MEPVRMEDLHAVAQRQYWTPDADSARTRLKKEPKSVKTIQEEFDKLLDAYSATRTIPLVILQQKFVLVLEQDPSGISLDLRGAVVEGQCFEIQSFKLPDGLTLSNGTLEVVEGMHIQDSEGIRLRKIGIIGVESGVRLIDSDIQMERCSITSSGTLLLSENSTAKLDDCGLCDSRSGDGLVAMGKYSYIAAKNCQFLENFGCCAYLFNGAGALFENCQFNGAREYVGLALKDDGSRVSAVRCEFSNNMRNGVAIGGGARAVLEHCTMQGTKKFHGLAVSDPGSKVSASECTFQENEQCGVFIANQASVTLEKCASSFSRQFSGVAIKDKWSMLLATGCEFADNQHCGVAAGGGSSVTLDNCVSTGARDFYGLGVTAEGTEVVARDCQFLDNQRCGIYIYSGGKATLENCMCKGSKEFDGLAVFGKGGVSQNSSRLIAQGCSFADNTRNGITVGGGAYAELIECISKTGAVGVAGPGRELNVIGKRNKVIVQRCDFGSSQGERQKLCSVFGNCFSP